MIMRCLNWISAKSLMSVQVLFLSCDVLFNIFPLKLFILNRNIMYYFFNKSSSNLITATSSISLSHDITVNTHCDVTMVRWHCLGNYVMSQWVGDVSIDTKQSWAVKWLTAWIFHTRSSNTWILYTRSRWFQNMIIWRHSKEYHIFHVLNLFIIKYR